MTGVGFCATAEVEIKVVLMNGEISLTY